ncbi:Mitochondrial outer membrane protein iml2 [Orbilia ellipsospora]|uniref:Mitochondrial outer membrane protein iml2 n=1 Tax=Orbilia ellipsospora TaxID=2528407 RepID=A0AAV9XA62_9PEZI
MEDDVRPKHFDRSEVSTVTTSSALWRPRNPSFIEKVGNFTFFILPVGMVFNLLCLAWFAFLWWGSSEIQFWQRIVIDGWLIRAISLPASALRLAISLQAGICLSMLAALALEKLSVPFSEVASVSMMRAGTPSLTSFYWDCLFPLVRNGTGVSKYQTYLLVVLAIGITSTSSILGFNSTILLSDVTIQPVPAYNATLTQVAIDFSYGPAFKYSIPQINNVWNSNRPGTFPVFAEHSEPPSGQLPQNVTDTGVSLRAFLPFANPTERQKIRNFTGKAMIFDSRVICLKPNIVNLDVSLGQAPPSSGGNPITTREYSGLKGTLLSPISSRNQTIHIDKLDLPAKVAFYCDSNDGFSICQLPNTFITEPRASRADPPTGSSYSGGVASEFRGPNTYAYSGAAYLMLSITSQLVRDGESISPPLPPGPDWGQYAVREKNAYLGGATYYRLVSASACYAALDAADRYVDIFSNRNRTELSSFRNSKFANSTYNFTDLLPQFMPGQPLRSAQDRGILEIRLPVGGWSAGFNPDSGSDGPWEIGGSHSISYINPMQELPYLVNALNMQVPKQGLADTFKVLVGNFSAVFEPGYDAVGANAVGFSFAAQPWIGDLFMDVLQADGSNTAVALQSVLTALAGIAYYDKLPEFDKVTNATAIFFNNVATVGGAFGLPRAKRNAAAGLSDFSSVPTLPFGFLTVAALVLIQMALTLIICIKFKRECKYSRLSDPWQAVAHVISLMESYDYATASSHIDSDRETVSNVMKPNSTENDRMTLDEIGGLVKLTRRRGRTKPNSRLI